MKELFRNWLTTVYISPNKRNKSNPHLIPTSANRYVDGIDKLQRLLNKCFWEENDLSVLKGYKTCVEGLGNKDLKSHYRAFLEFKKESITINIEESIKTEIEKINANLQLSAEEKKAYIKVRLGQTEYRKKLIDYWGGCSVSGLTRKDLLIASHIKPYAEANDNEKYDLYNGLLLTPNYDKLFDQYLISFEENGEIMISKSIKKEEWEILNINETAKIDEKKITPKHKEYLSHHRQKFENKENER